MDIQRLLNSRRVGELALRLSHSAPPGLGYQIADWVSGWIASKHSSPLVQAIRANQWVAGGETIDARELDLQARAVLNHAGISFYNLFHNLQNPSALQNLVDFTPEIQATIQRSQEDRYGLVVAGVHLSNFDLVAQAAATRGLKAFALSLPEPGDVIQWQHDLRRRSGLEILDASLVNFTPGDPPASGWRNCCHRDRPACSRT